MEAGLCCTLKRTLFGLCQAQHHQSNLSICPSKQQGLARILLWSIHHSHKWKGMQEWLDHSADSTGARVFLLNSRRWELKCTACAPENSWSPAAAELFSHLCIFLFLRYQVANAKPIKIPLSPPLRLLAILSLVLPPFLLSLAQLCFRPWSSSGSGISFSAASCFQCWCLWVSDQQSTLLPHPHPEMLSTAQTMPKACHWRLTKAKGRGFVFPCHKWDRMQLSGFA